MRHDQLQKLRETWEVIRRLKQNTGAKTTLGAIGAGVMDVGVSAAAGAIAGSTGGGGFAVPGALIAGGYALKKVLQKDDDFAKDKAPAKKSTAKPLKKLKLATEDMKKEKEQTIEEQVQALFEGWKEHGTKHASDAQTYATKIVELCNQFTKYSKEWDSWRIKDLARRLEDIYEDLDKDVEGKKARAAEEAKYANRRVYEEVETPVVEEETEEVSEQIVKSHREGIIGRFLKRREEKKNARREADHKAKVISKHGQKYWDHAQAVAKKSRMSGDSTHNPENQPTKKPVPKKKTGVARTALHGVKKKPEVKTSGQHAIKRSDLGEQKLSEDTRLKSAIKAIKPVAKAAVAGAAIGAAGGPVASAGAAVGAAATSAVLNRKNIAAEYKRRRAMKDIKEQKLAEAGVVKSLVKTAKGLVKPALAPIVAGAGIGALAGPAGAAAGAKFGAATSAAFLAMARKDIKKEYKGHRKNTYFGENVGLQYINRKAVK